MLSSLTNKIRNFFTPAFDELDIHNTSRKRKRTVEDSLPADLDADVIIVSSKRPKLTSGEIHLGFLKNLLSSNAMADWVKKKKKSWNNSFFFRNLSTKDHSALGQHRHAEIPLVNGRIRLTQQPFRGPVLSSVKTQTDIEVTAQKYAPGRDAPRQNSFVFNEADQDSLDSVETFPQNRKSLFGSSGCKNPDFTVTQSVRLDEKERYRQLLQHFTTVSLNRTKAMSSNRWPAVSQSRGSSPLSRPTLLGSYMPNDLLGTARKKPSVHYKQVAPPEAVHCETAPVPRSPSPTIEASQLPSVHYKQVAPPEAVHCETVPVPRSPSPTIEATQLPSVHYKQVALSEAVHCETVPVPRSPIPTIEASQLPSVHYKQVAPPEAVHCETAPVPRSPIPTIEASQLPSVHYKQVAPPEAVHCETVPVPRSPSPTIEATQLPSVHYKQVTLSEAVHCETVPVPRSPSPTIEATQLPSVHYKQVAISEAVHCETVPVPRSPSPTIESSQVPYYHHETELSSIVGEPGESHVEIAGKKKIDWRSKKADLFKQSELLNKAWINDMKNRYSANVRERQRKIAEEEIKIKIYKERRKEKENDLEKRIRDRMVLYEIEPAVLEEQVEEEDVKETVPEFPELSSKMNRLIDSALRPHPPDEVISEGFKLQITRRDIATLSKLNWLNDEIINFYMNMLMSRGDLDNFPKVYAFNTFFCPKIMKGGHSSVRRWTRRVDIFSYDYLLIPVHLGMHWCLAVVDFRKKFITYFDSMGGKNMQYLIAIRKYLCDEKMDKKKTTFNTEDWQLETAQDIPQQMNGSDCGMFACKYAEYITRGAKITFTQKNMPYFRRRMVHEIATKTLL